MAYLAFVLSGRVDVEPWWATSDLSLWQECGFATRPSYPTVWTRFIELKQVADAFAEVAGLLIVTRAPARMVSSGVTCTSTDTNLYDRHGVPRCKHCGGPGEYHRFVATPTPRFWFRCQGSG